MQLKVVSEPVGALHPHQDGVLLLRAEAHGQPVGAGAGTLVGGPGERDESAALPEDIGGPGWGERQRRTERERDIRGVRSGPVEPFKDEHSQRFLQF